MKVLKWSVVVFVNFALYYGVITIIENRFMFSFLNIILPYNRNICECIIIGHISDNLRSRLK